MKKLLFLITLIVIIVNYNTKAQQDCEKNSSSWLNYYKQQASYIPSVNPYIGEVRIPINIIIVADNNGDFGAYTPAEFASEIYAFAWLNVAYRDTDTPSDPAPGFSSNYWLEDTKVVFERNQVYFYNNTTFFNEEAQHDQLLEYHFSIHPEAVNFINCFMVKYPDDATHPDIGGYADTYTLVNGTIIPIVVSKAWKNPAYPPPYQFYGYWAGHLDHELGHLLGLGHTYHTLIGGGDENNNVDYLNDVFFNLTQFEPPCDSVFISDTDFCTNNLMSGHGENNFISPLQAGRIHRNLRTDGNYGISIIQNNIIRHFGYGYSSIPHEITNNEIWDFVYKSYNDIVIKNGATLTITCRLEMVREAKIVVEQGGKLIVDGGTITSARCAGPLHEGFWQGIEVQGNSSQHQYTVGGSCAQGTVILQNGAIIENAECGIKTINSDATNPSTSAGGIVIADNSTFRNCRKAIEFMPYRNFHPTTNDTLPNLSSISQCTFETDKSVNPDIEPLAFIRLCGVQGVKIKGCEFKNLTPSANPQENGIGIFSVNSGFNLTSVCTPQANPCPEGNIVKNKFNDLYYGVWAGLSMLPINIEQSEFENNYCGIIAFHAQNVNIINNDVNVGTIGIVLNKSNAYKIEENTFISENSAANYGVVVIESGSHPNLIYKNTFENGLSIPCHAEGKNCESWGTLPVDVPHPLYMGAGLVFKCNEYNGTDQLCDIEITSGGIAGNQGYCHDASTPAGNTFNTGPPYPCGNIAVGSHVSSPFTYYHHNDANALPDVFPSNSPFVTLHSCGVAINSGSCPEYFSGSNPSNLISLINSFTSILTSKVTPVINGNTQNLLDKVITANTSGGITFAALKNELLAASPYLSDTILIASIEKYDTLEPVMLKDIMVANSPLPYRVITVLNGKSLPDSIKFAIDTVQSGISARAELEAEIIDTMMLMGFAENELVRQYLNDTAISGIDSVISYFSTRTDDYSKKALVEAYFAKGDSTSLISALDSLTLRSYSDTLYKEFYTLMADFCTNHKLLFEIDSSQEQTIREIAASKTEAAPPAQAVLALVYGEIPDIDIEKLDIPDSLSIHGYLRSDSLCNGMPVSNDSLIILDAETNKISYVSVVTDSAGYFVFYLPELLKLGDTAFYGFGASDGTPVKNFELKTISQWIAASPVNLTLQKTEADFAFDSIRCFGDSVHFTAVITGGLKPYTYIWNFGNDSASASQHPAFSYNQADTFNVLLIVSSADGCSDTVSKSITVNPLPSATISPSTTTICAGDSATLTASGGGAYLWNTADTTAAITVSPLSNLTYIVTVTNIYGCNDIASRVVTVNPLPEVAITPESLTICAGDSAILTASGGGTYLWSTSDTTAAITVITDSTTDYSVTVTNGYGCTNTASRTIIVNPLPEITISPAAITLCPGDSVTLTASGGATYLWGASDSTSAIKVSPDSTTSYTVMVTSYEGCTAIDTVIVTVGTFTITGRSMYAGKANTGTSPHPPTYDSRAYDINNEIVILKDQSGTEIARDTSDINGAFTFTDICNGTYALYYDKYTSDTMQWVNNVNTIDLSIILAFINADTTSDSSKNFSRIYKKAADVDNSGVITTTDRSKIQAKIGSPQNPSFNFTKGNWVDLDTSITVNSYNVNITIPVISYGDYNASSSKYLDSTNTWSQVKSLPDKNIIYFSDENMVINGSGILEIPLRINSGVDGLSALGLTLFYPGDKFRLVSASMPNTNDSNGVFKINPTLQEIIDRNDDLLVTEDSGIIRVVFATIDYFDVESNEVLINLGFEPLYELEQGELVFKLSGTGVIGNQYGEELSKDYNFLVMPKIFVQGNQSVTGFDFAGYPNPFNGNAILDYNLPEDGNVKISVYNNIGEQVCVLVNEYQVVGKHAAEFAPKKLAQGMYTFKLEFTGAEDSKCLLIRMIH